MAKKTIKTTQTESDTKHLSQQQYTAPFARAYKALRPAITDDLVRQDDVDRASVLGHQIADELASLTEFAPEE